jgi:hypothetical protein
VTEPPAEAQVIRTAALVNTALMTGATAFLGFALYQMVSRMDAAGREKDPWMVLGILAGVWLATRVATPIVMNVREPLLLKENAAEQYLQSLIVRMTLHEGPTLFGIVGLLMFGADNPLPAHPETALFLVPYAAMMLSGISQWPTMERFREQVRLAEENGAMRRKTAG